MALEATIADIGALLVQLDKFRAGAPLHPGLLADALALGDRARRHLRVQALDATADAALGAEAASLHARVQRALDDVRASDAYREAVAAHAAGDLPALTRLLPLVFAGLTPVPAPSFLWHAPAWLRRNRPRTAGEMVAAVARIAATGLEADGDPMAPGIDPSLPAVPLDTTPPLADPVLLRWSQGDVPPAVFRLDATDAILVHVPRLTAPFAVVLPAQLDDDELGEVSLDHPRYRAELIAALADAGIAVAGG